MPNTSTPAPPPPPPPPAAGSPYPPPPTYCSGAARPGEIHFAGMPPSTSGYGEPYSAPIGTPAAPQLMPQPWIPYGFPYPSNSQSYYWPTPPGGNNINIHCHGDGRPGSAAAPLPPPPPGGQCCCHPPAYWPPYGAWPIPAAAGPQPPAYGFPPTAPTAPTAPSAKPKQKPREKGAPPEMRPGMTYLYSAKQTHLHIIKPFGHKPWDNPDKAFDFHAVVAPCSMSVAELAEEIGASKEQAMTEGLEVGCGRWSKGRTRKGSEKDAGKTRLDAVGWGQGNERHPVWIVVHD